MHPNWFVGLPVPANGWYEQRVVRPPDGLRLFHAADLHITLAFLGGCNEEAARRAWALACEWPLGRVPANLGAVVPMGNPRRWTALSAMLRRGREEVEQAMSLCRDRWLEAAGARPDRRPPKAHLTLARPRRGAGRAERDAALAWAATLDLNGIELALDRIVLFTWADDRRERMFREVETRVLED